MTGMGADPVPRSDGGVAAQLRVASQDMRQPREQRSNSDDLPHEGMTFFTGACGVNAGMIQGSPAPAGRRQGYGAVKRV